MRIEIIRQLRKLYPNNFIGGIAASELAKELCPDLIFSKKYTRRDRYLELVKKSDICIGSVGLHNSIGWKTAEYIATSRAIINERLRYKVTGDFEEGKNYLSFESVDECLAHVEYLMNNPDLVFKMKQENYKYYNDYLRPDKLVLNALKTAGCL